MKHTKLMTAVMGFAVAGTIAVSAQSAEMPNVTIVNDTIPTSLTGTPGDAVKGRAIADRKSTRLNSSHITTSYAVFCLKKKKRKKKNKIKTTSIHLRL